LSELLTAADLVVALLSAHALPNFTPSSPSLCFAPDLAYLKDDWYSHLHAMPSHLLAATSRRRSSFRALSPPLLGLEFRPNGGHSLGG